MTHHCSSCEFHKSRANKAPGKLIPGESGKCTRPEGLCEETAPTVQQGTLSTRVLEHIAAMSNGSSPDTVFTALKQRAVEALALAQGMFAAAGKDAKFADVANQDAIALAAVSEWDVAAALMNLRHMIISFLGPQAVPEAPLKAWAERAAVDAASLDAPPEKPAAAPDQSDDVLTESDLAALDGMNRDMGALQAAYGEDRDLANQLLGQAQMAEAIGQFAQAISLTKLLAVKERKLYKALKGVQGKDREGNTIEDMGTWDGFCRALGSTRSKADEDLSNLKTFGQDALEALSRVGAGYRELRAMRALPEADREAIAAEAARATTREELLDLLEEVQARDAAKLEAKAKEADDLQADLDARDKLLETKAQALDTAQIELEKLKSLPPNENLRLRLDRESGAVQALEESYIAALAELNKFLAQVGTMAEADGLSAHTWKYACETVRLYCESVNAALAEHGIPVDFEDIIAPAWARDAAKQDIADSNVVRTQGGGF